MIDKPSKPAADGLPPLRDVIAAFGLSAQKSLGQNFLLDLNLTGRIARAAAPLDDVTVLEVGPGPGGLTRAILAAGAKRLVAVEKDRRCLEALRQVAEAYPGRLTVIEGDALEILEEDVIEGPAKIIANLPYNVATPLLLKWLGKARLFQSMTLMFQREVADRIVAEPRSKAYGRLSVISQWHCEATKLFDISPKAFTPPPKVTSTVVQLVPRKTPLYPAEAAKLEKVTAAAFGQRRKMLRASLKSLGVDTLDLLERAGVEPTARAEELTIEEFCALARLI